MYKLSFLPPAAAAAAADAVGKMISDHVSGNWLAQNDRFMAGALDTCLGRC